MTTNGAPALEAERPRIGRAAYFAAVAVGVLASLVADTAISFAARALGAPEQFQQLGITAYGPITVIAVLVGGIGWRLIVTRTRNAARVLRILVPVMLVLSFIPDLALIPSTGGVPGSGTGIAALMAMHLAVTLAAVAAYRRFMPARA
ncbi:MAG TPA: DUF6069 family protein [Arthrobacter sp.]